MCDARICTAAYKSSDAFWGVSTSQPKIIGFTNGGTLAAPEVRLIKNIRKDLPEIKFCCVYLHYSLPRTPLDPPPMPRPSLSTINYLRRKNRAIKLRHSNPTLEESGDVKQCAVGLQNLPAKWARSMTYKFTFIRLCQTKVQKLFTLPLTSCPQSKSPSCLRGWSSKRLPANEYKR